MPSSPTTRPTIPSTVWLARGRHVGPTPQDALRISLQRLKDSEAIQDFLELPEADSAPDSVFEARWPVAEGVTVRARLTLAPDVGEGREWVLAAEAERPWDPQWPSPATKFWPEEPDATWDHDPATGLRLGDLGLLPEDDKAVRRVFRNAVRGSWAVNIVVHEAMTTDERGRRPLARLLPPSLRHCVVEHRAAPHQLRIVNWALRDFGVQVPRGGAVVLPATPASPDHSDQDFSVRSVFLDGSQPTELIDTVTRFAASPRPLPDGAGAAVTALREDWRLLTLEEELERERRLVAMYTEALAAMTKSRDLYREAAERANEALAALREASPGSEKPSPPGALTASPFQQLTRTFERLKGTAKSRRPAPAVTDTSEEDGGEDRKDPADD
jgi:hypothetical protein